MQWEDESEIALLLTWVKEPRLQKIIVGLQHGGRVISVITAKSVFISHTCISYFGIAKLTASIIRNCKVGALPVVLRTKTSSSLCCLYPLPFFHYMSVQFLFTSFSFLSFLIPQRGSWRQLCEIALISNYFTFNWIKFSLLHFSWKAIFNA